MMRRRPAIFLVLLALGLLTLSGCFSSSPRAEFEATPRFDYPPLEVSLDAGASSSPNGAIVSYAWDFGDGETGAGVSVSHTYPEKGVYTVVLTVTDEAGKNGSRSMTVEALNRIPVAAFQPSVYTAPVHYPVRFDASESHDPDGEIVDYVWAFGDGDVGEGVLVEHEYETAGETGWRPQITLTVIDDDGAQSSRTHTIIIVGCDACAG
ncbi:MAG: PKD domain-containing protein [Candidatus Bipolaricaulia bacterium]